MKKLLVFLTIILPGMAFSQDAATTSSGGGGCGKDCNGLTQRFYIGLRGGYQIPWHHDILGQTFGLDANGDRTIRNVYGGLGRGGVFEFFTGYMICKNFGFELGFDYLMGQRVKRSQFFGVPGDNFDQNAVNAAGGVSDYQEVHSNTQKWRLKPGFVFKTNPCCLGGNMSFYSRVGAVIPVAGRTFTDIDYRVFDGNGNIISDNDIKYKTKGRPTIGLMGALGMAYNLGCSGLLLTAEVEGLAYSQKRDESSLSSWKRNGQSIKDDPNLVKEYQRKIEYQNEITPSIENTDAQIIDPNQPLKRLAVRTRFNTLGFKLGIMKVF